MKTARPWPTDLRMLTCECPPLSLRKPASHCTKTIARCNGMIRAIREWQDKQEAAALQLNPDTICRVCRKGRTACAATVPQTRWDDHAYEPMLKPAHRGGAASPGKGEP